MIKIYNSYTNKLEEFHPIHENEVSMYVCGSTVYNDMHIGNSRPIVFFDVVVRFFQYLGYKVRMVSNFTDIDDKIINKAKEENVEESVISERYIASILETYHQLNCLPHYKNPKVTENMNEIISFIELLIQKGGAYVVDGDVYFDVSKVKNYGILSGQTQENLITGARISENEKKRNANDFNLWKETTEGKKWHSPWSDGRPGWHTECVVMISNIFKGKIDIHGGGIELKFPHHDNEIAQAEVAYNHAIANYWMHNGRIDLNGVKMSKSLGNVIMAKDLLKEIGYGPYRLLLLNVPYHQPLNYRQELTNQAINDYDKIINTKKGLIYKLQIEKNITDYKVEKITDSVICSIREEFINALSDDFNTANGLTALWKLIKLMNQLSRQKEFDVQTIKESLTLLDEMMWVYGIDKVINPLNNEDLEIVSLWKEARNNKDFLKADEYRKLLNAKGIML